VGTLKKKENDVRILMELFITYRTKHLNLRIRKEAEKMLRLFQRLSRMQRWRSHRKINGLTVVLT